MKIKLDSSNFGVWEKVSKNSQHVAAQKVIISFFSDLFVHYEVTSNSSQMSNVTFGNRICFHFN